MTDLEPLAAVSAINSWVCRHVPDVPRTRQVIGTTVAALTPVQKGVVNRTFFGSLAPSHAARNAPAVKVISEDATVPALGMNFLGRAGRRRRGPAAPTGWTGRPADFLDNRPPHITIMLVWSRRTARAGTLLERQQSIVCRHQQPLSEFGNGRSYAIGSCCVCLQGILGHAGRADSIGIACQGGQHNFAFHHGMNI